MIGKNGFSREEITGHIITALAECGKDGLNLYSVARKVREKIFLEVGAEQVQLERLAANAVKPDDLMVCEGILHSIGAKTWRDKDGHLVYFADNPQKPASRPASIIVVDIEADGPIPGDYSMISFGAVLVDGQFGKTFYGKCRPISEQWVPEALKVSGHTRNETLGFPDPLETMLAFDRWLSTVCPSGKVQFYSDNNGFDWSFINWYFHHFMGRNPFGHSSRNVNDLYKGIKRKQSANFKRDKLCKTKHTHHPVDDAMGVAEALVAMMEAARMPI